MSDNIFSADFFAGNRARLKHQISAGVPVVLVAHGLLQQGADAAYPFYQDRSFWYLTGVDEPGIVAVFDGDSEYLIVPGRESVREQFDGAVDTQLLSRQSGIEQVLGEREGWARLQTLVKKNKRIATVNAPPRFIESLGMYTNPARADFVQRIQGFNSACKIVDIRQTLAGLRTIKQPLEISAIQRAVDITVDTLKDVTDPERFARYRQEFEIEADITQGFRRRGAEQLGHAFAPIVASGPRACTLHYVQNNAALAVGDAVVLDVGARAHGYAADITRTVLYGNQPSQRQQQVYSAVLAVQEYALSLLRPGVVLHDYETAVERFMGEQLLALQLVKKATHDAIRQYFPHATSHFLGLDTHDAGIYEQPLAAGAVLTVEPGIYIAQEGIGIRIEDDIVIVAGGNKVLSEALPRRLM